MTRIKWPTCIAVSLIVAAVAAIPMVGGNIPDEGVVVIDPHKWLDVQGMTSEQLAEHVKNPPTRMLHGIDRYRYALSTGLPLAYLFALCFNLAVVFPATVIVSYLHHRQTT